jgi:indolepyruvate ferredoxin oxidoreductase beta subunit
MTLHDRFASRDLDPSIGGIIKLAVMAVGGQGGGVLGSWIEDLARSNGYVAQATSVAGVAQRTGSTIYYVEMAPKCERQPVFSLMPAAGDVDVLVAAEMMEAGRAILRGFVTPDRTTLIASTHRALAVSEKVVPGDGIASSDEVRAAVAIAAQRSVLFDMDRVAIDNGSVISASLFGALAGSGALPFPREAFAAAIRTSGKGVDASLRAFNAAADLAEQTTLPLTEAKPIAASTEVSGPVKAKADWQALLTRVDELPAPVRDMARAGLGKVVDFQSLTYGVAYLDRLDAVAKLDRADHNWELTRESAKYIANAMAYDDVIRVADLKTRPRRFDRIGQEMRASQENLLQLTEYFHPRAEEIVGLLPVKFGGRWQADQRRMKQIDRFFNRGRRIRTDRALPFLLLWLIGGQRNWRMKTLRHHQEMKHLDRWLSDALCHAESHYPLAVELIRCRRLIKGYSDTHMRGQSKFEKVMAAGSDLSKRDDAADWVRRLREAALKDEEGRALDGALETVRSFL